MNDCPNTYVQEQLHLPVNSVSIGAYNGRLQCPEIVSGQAHLSIFSVTELCKSDSHQHHTLLPVLVYVCYLFHLHVCCIAEIMILPLANPFVLKCIALRDCSIIEITL